jgi:hypothetical protein
VIFSECFSKKTCIKDVSNIKSKTMWRREKPAQTAAEEASAGLGLGTGLVVGGSVGGVGAYIATKQAKKAKKDEEEAKQKLQDLENRLAENTDEFFQNLNDFVQKIDSVEYDPDELIWNNKQDEVHSGKYYQDKLLEQEEKLTTYKEYMREAGKMHGEKVTQLQQEINFYEKALKSKGLDAVIDSARTAASGGRFSVCPHCSVKYGLYV